MICKIVMEEDYLVFINFVFGFCIKCMRGVEFVLDVVKEYFNFFVDLFDKVMDLVRECLNFVEDWLFVL